VLADTDELVDVDGRCSWMVRKGFSVTHRAETGLIRNGDYETYTVVWVHMMAPIPTDETLTDKRVECEIYLRDSRAISTRKHVSLRTFMLEYCRDHSELFLFQCVCISRGTL